MCPGDDKYIINSPTVVSASIDVGNGKYFSVVAENQSPENVYIDSVLLNGEELDRNYILHSEIVAGGELRYVLAESSK